MKQRKRRKLSHRFTAILLCVCMITTMISGIGISRAYADGAGGDTRSGASGGTSGVTRQADPSTMDTYRDMLNLEYNTRYAGRLWSDKTVFAKGQEYTGDTATNDKGRVFDGTTLTINEELDGTDEDKKIELDEDFMHVYSVLGSSEEIEETAPLDVMFVVDVSGSMGQLSDHVAQNVDEFKQTPIYKTVDAINNAIAQLLKGSPNSRFGIAIYGSTAAVLVPLGHYTKGSADFLKAEYGEIYGGNQGLHYKLEATVKEESGGEKKYYADNAGETSNAAHKDDDGNEGTGTGNRIYAGTGGHTTGIGTSSGDDAFHVGHITNPQAGLAAAMDQFIEQDERTWKTHDGTACLRIPALIHLTDGQACDIAWIQDPKKEGAVAQYDWEKTVSNWNNVNWKYDLAYNSQNGDTGINKWNASQLTGKGDATPVIFQTLLTAAYYKSAVNAFYNAAGAKDLNGNAASLTCYSVYASDTQNYENLENAENLEDKEGQVKDTIDAILSPAQYFRKYEDDPSPGKGKFIKEAYGLFEKWKNGDDVKDVFKTNTTSSNGSDTNHAMDNITITLNANKEQTKNGKYSENRYSDWNQGITVDTVAENINYVPKDNFFHTGFDELNGVFGNIIQQLTDTMFSPVSGGNDLGVDDSVTYMDPIGQYMEVKDVKNVLLFGELHDVTKTAVYNWQFNDDYVKSHDLTGQPFQPGWYWGDDGTTAVKASGDLPDSCNSNEEAWAAGWEYRLDTDTAVQFVPSLSGDINRENPDSKIKLTDYTFYRLTDENRNDLHMNPAYLEDGQKEDEALSGKKYSEDGTHLNDPGVYALSDMRIWVEDTSDYNDTLVSDPGIESDSNFDQALWVNLPVNMLPLRKVTITQDSGSGNWKYESNLKHDTPAHTASFPMRVFYTVGMSGEVLENGRINVAGALSAQYIEQNKITTTAAHEARNLSEGDIEFFSNWYNPENRYSDYATTNTDYSYGDPVVTFSPSDDNRYYIFQNPLPLYNTAYVWVPEDKLEPSDKDNAQYTNFISEHHGLWKRVNLEEDLTGESDARTFDPADFGGRLLYQDLKPAAATEQDPTPLKTLQENMWTALGDKASDVRDGDIVLLNDHRLNDVTRPSDEELDGGTKKDPFSSDSYYYMPLDFFTRVDGGLGEDDVAVQSQFVVARKGSEFGSAYKSSHIGNGDMLCWYDKSGNYDAIYPYLSYTETKDSSRGKEYIGAELDANGKYKNVDENGVPTDKTTNPSFSDTHEHMLEEGDWVVAAKPGGIRVGALAQAVGEKTRTAGGDAYTTYDEYKKERFSDASGDFTVGYYAGNVTRTANNYYVPTLSINSSLDTERDVIVNTYQGNNGRLVVQDTTLLVTKLVEPPEGETFTDDEQSEVNNEEFLFQVYVNKYDGPMDAVVVRYNNGTWQRQFHYIDLKLDSKLFLQTKNGQMAMTDVAGKLITGSPGSYTYADSGKEYSGTVYYVYIGGNSVDAGASGTNFRVYHNPSVDDTESVSADDVAIRNADGEPAKEGEKSTFYANKVYLVSQSDYDAHWGELDPAVTPNFDASTHDGKLLENFELMTIDPNVSDTTDVYFDTPYLADSSYWTKRVEFGKVSADAGDAALTADGLYDQIIPTGDRSDYFNEDNGNNDNREIAKYTAQFTLKHGEGLLFSGIPSNTVYRVTEKLTEEQMDAGYTLKEVSHNQQVGSTSTYRPGTQQIPVYYNTTGEGTLPTYGWYGGGMYPTAYASNTTEKGLMWTLDKNGTENDSQYRHYEPFHHTNAVVWDAYSTMDATAQGDNHHQPTGVPDGKSVFWLWHEDTQASTNEGGEYVVGDNPSCKPLEQGGCDEEVGDQVRHYFFKDGVLRDQHYEGEGSGYIRNIGRYITSPTVHFGVKNEDQEYAKTDMTQMKSNIDYTGVYSVFGNTGTYEESANFINTISNDKTETQINGETVEASESDPNTYPGVKIGDEITYEIKWSNATSDKARVVIIDPLDAGVDFVSAPAGTDTTAGTFYENMEDANTALKEIYKDSDPANIPELDYGHVVIWDLGEKDSGSSGDVTLTVKVNGDAAKWWDYDGDGVADEPVDGSASDPDFMVRNRATVRVADNAYTTNTVKNPVGEPDKTETAIERGENAQDNGLSDSTPVTEEDPDANLTPGEDGKWHGPLVFVGDKITYEIEWRNYESEAAAISIRDPLDKNVAFVSAEYDPNTFVDADGNSIDTLFDSSGQPIGTQNIKAGGSSGDVPSDVKVKGYGKDGETERDTISYTSKDHTVTYNLGKVPAGSSGTVTLVVEVLDSATPTGYVDNTAFVSVGNEIQQTKTVENPTPHQEKTEVTPGDGVMVQTGDEITYAIDWHNYKSDAACVIVMDTLDPGVDFVSADNGGTYYPDGGSVPADGDMEQVDIPENTVAWVLDNQPANAEGTVNLTVKVNENAALEYTYNDEADGLTPTPDEKDYEVLNQARVKVGNDTFLKTQIVENPVPEKTESAVDHTPSGGEEDNNPSLAPKPDADDTVVGPLVYVGDEIEYKIHWKNGHDEAADVTIVDPLDEGVDFVSADNGGNYNEDAHTVTWTLKAQEAGAEGDVTLTVKVNEKATPVGFVDNQASVRVNGDAFVKTEIVENPTPHVEKTEVSPGEGMQVMPGDEIDYQITWHNYEEEDADVIITDKLDPGVDFVSAAVNGSEMVNSGTGVQKPTAADLSILLKGEEGVDSGTEFTFTLELSAPAGTELSPGGYSWKKDGDSGTWTPSDNTITLKPGESLTVEDLPVGTLYTLTPKDGEAVVEDQAIGLYGSSVTVTVKAAQAAALSMNGEPTEIAPAGDEPPEDGSGDGQPGEDSSDEGQSAGNGPGDGQPEGEQSTGAQQSGTPRTGASETSTVYTFSAVTEDLEEPANTSEFMLLSLSVSGFDTDKQELNGEKPTISHSFTDEQGNNISMYYFANAHTVVWVLEQRPANAEGVVDLKVRVNEDAEKFWSYDNPTLGPSANEDDDRVRNQAGVQVGNNPEVKTRIIENPTNPVKTETQINGEDVSKDLIADANGYVGPDVSVGDRITYQIQWLNNAVDAETGEPVDAEITITDALDPGVDFVSADNGGVYDPKTRTVTWALGEQDARARGTVTLTVRVNKSAVDPKQVENSATVTVGNRSQQTDKVTNNVNTGGALTVSKTVTGNLGDKTREFHFTVTLDDTGINGRHGDMVFEAGVAQFTLKDGESRTATGLPEGTGYKVTEAEADQDGYRTAAEGDVGKIPMSDTVAAEFTNHRDMEPHKTEVTPGDGKTVQPGDEITYDITWQNPEAEKLTVIIRDPLDPGVDFVSADNGGVYDVGTHTVIWTFVAEADTAGKVSLTVRVNESALAAGVVQNQAFVKVGNYPEIATEIPENPVGSKNPPFGSTFSFGPKTGDYSQLGVWIMMFVASLTGFTVCAVSLLQRMRRRSRAAARRRRSRNMNRRR